MIEHRPGQLHCNADALTRQCEQCDVNHSEPQKRRNVKVVRNVKTLDEEEHEYIKKIHETLGHVGKNKLIDVLKERGCRLGNGTSKV